MTLKHCLYLLFFPALGAAQPLPALVDEALRNNREILAAQKKYEAARQRPAQASSLPEPTVSLGYSSNGAPYPVAGIGVVPTANAGVMVSQEMPFPGKQKLRGEMAAKEADAEFQQYLSVRLSVVSRLKQAYHELHHANVAIAFTRRDQELLESILRISEARYAAGRAAQQDIFKAQTQFSIFEAQLLRYQQEQTSKEIEIDALLNRPPGGPPSTSPPTWPRASCPPRSTSCWPTPAPLPRWPGRGRRSSAPSSPPTSPVRITTPTTRSRAAISTRGPCRPCGSSAWISNSPRTSGAASAPPSTSGNSARPKRATPMKPPASRSQARIREQYSAATTARAWWTSTTSPSCPRPGWRSNRPWPGIKREPSIS